MIAYFTINTITARSRVGMKRLSILALSAVVAAVLAGCQGQSRIQPVAEQPVISVADPSEARPVQFSRIVIDRRRGEQIGTFREGRGYCSQAGTLIYRGGRMTFDDRELSETFRHELERANTGSSAIRMRCSTMRRAGRRNSWSLAG